jgi:hypothetical protein
LKAALPADCENLPNDFENLSHDREMGGGKPFNDQLEMAI